METTIVPWAEGIWRRLLADAVTDLHELLTLLDLSRAAVGAGRAADQAARQFTLRVPRGYVDLMQQGDPNDPLLRQVLPVDSEGKAVCGFTTDPLGENIVRHDPPLLQKYRGRALVLTTPACAIHCRYCFRRHFSSTHTGISGGDTSTLFEELVSDPSLSEVILSGGDPLVLTDDILEDLCSAFERGDHLRRIRLHTRTPVVLPERIDNGFLNLVTRRRLPVVIVIHANHARELSPQVAIACGALNDAGVTLLNQSVLLAGVNDTPDTLVELSERLFELGVHPYYLHLLDRVAGASHFDVPEDRARRLVGAAAARLPGYLVPRLVREEIGAPAKIIVSPAL